MAHSIDYYFTSISPFAYLGHDALMAVAAQHGCEVNFKPFNLAGVWEASGSVPLPQRSPVRQRYRLIELQRIAELRGVDLNLKPAHFPTDPTLADHCAIAFLQAGADPADFVRSVCEAVWVKDLNISDREVIGELIEAAGQAKDTVLDIAESGVASAIRQANTEAAVTHDAIGAPSYVYKGEVFWGQDRIDYLERMIASGRDAFKAE